ncbi:thyrostimulin alpha-2 subunit-like isoform X2 [Ostrea edulis]|uniref:thyrostimulin alpha-2 subunit-like isoform X2 n=1 Tax=Ostrea edulis TaxID=37623 RepID=UPI0020941841|nr:thyrostimulin alpha-2 subunit-like isoform X2 [Ostrea edulis]
MRFNFMWIFFFLIQSVFGSFDPRSFQKAGCFRMGHTRIVQIPGCLQFNVTTNACRGFCESYAIPSSQRTLLANRRHFLTSRAECCGIEETHDITVSVRCANGLREVTFRSAKSCACSMCRYV